MKRWLKFALISLALICSVLIAGAGWYISKAIPIGTGYAAKYLCSSVYISQREPEIVFRDDIAPVHFLYSIIDADTRTENGLKVAVADSFGFFKSKAVFREGSGCTLVVVTTDDALKNQTFMNSGPDESSVDSLLELPQNLPWPDGDRESLQPLPPGIDADKLKLAVDHAFAEPGPENKRNTRAILVVYDGQLIAERYARIVRRTAEKEYPNYYTFLRQELFEKIGMQSAIMEPDPSGTFVGSSYTFATPRDWARFGLFYLQDGVWKGKRILMEEIL
jgi:hypothetical protein